MQFLLVITTLILSGSLMAQVTYGDGSDDCNWTVDVALTKSAYNCQSVNIPFGVTVSTNTLAAPVIIRALGTVTIAGTLDMSADGVNNAGDPGPGGGSGGVCAAGPCNNVNAAGSTGGEGLGGNVATASFSDLGGGGGTGGRYGSDIAPTGGAAGLGGANAGSSLTAPATGYGSESNFLSSFTAGIGGGAGGSGYNNSDNPTSAGAGGDGGGAVAIFAKGAIDLSSTGSIKANGGNGVAGPADASGGALAGGGGGGGGSGGSIFLYTEVTLTLDGSLSVVGGSGALGGAQAQTGQGGAGGNGGSGRIRLDSPSGSYTGTPNLNGVTPVTTVVDVPVTVTPSTQKTFSSDIEYACAAKSSLDFSNFILAFMLGLTLILGIKYMFEKYKLLR